MESKRKPCNKNSVLRLTRSTDGIRLIQKISRRLEICNKLRRPFMMRVVRRKIQDSTFSRNKKIYNQNTYSNQIDDEQHANKVSYKKDISSIRNFQMKKEFIYVQSDEENDLDIKSFNKESNVCIIRKPDTQIEEEKHEFKVLQQNISNKECIKMKKDCIYIQSDDDELFILPKPSSVQSEEADYLNRKSLKTPKQTSTCIVQKPSVQDSELKKQENPLLISNALFTKKKKKMKSIEPTLVSQCDGEKTKNEKSFLVSSNLFSTKKKRVRKKRKLKKKENSTMKNLKKENSFEISIDNSPKKEVNIYMSDCSLNLQNKDYNRYVVEQPFFVKEDTELLDEEISEVQGTSDLHHLHRVSSIFKARERGELDIVTIKPKTGPWSKAEVMQLETNMTNFLKSYNMSSSKSLVFPSTDEELEFRRKTKFNLKICRGIQRYGQSIMRKVVIHFVGALKEGYPTGKEAQMFWKMIKIHGKNWKLIGNLLKRTPQSLYHFYIHEKNKKNKNFQTRSWFHAETEMLIRSVDESFKKGDKIRWNKISEQLESRSPMQCRQKWWWIKKQILNNKSFVPDVGFIHNAEVVKQLYSQSKF